MRSSSEDEVVLVDESIDAVVVEVGAVEEVEVVEEDAVESLEAGSLVELRGELRGERR